MTDIVQVLKLVTELDDSGLKRLKSGLDEVEGSSGKAAGALSRIGPLAAGITVAGVGALAAGMGASVKVAADFEQSLANVASVTGATKDELVALRKEALQVGKDTSKSASESVEAFGELLKAGMSVKDVVGGAGRTVVQLAEATGQAVPEMAALLSNALNTFGLGADQAANVANTIARAANASAIDVRDLAYSLQAVGPVAAQAGLSIDDFGTAIGILGNNALKGSDAGTSLKTMLLSLTAPTDKAKALLDDLGVKVFDDAGKIRSFRDIIGDLQKALAGMTDEQRSAVLKDIFGTDAIRAANILLKEGVEGWDRFREAMAQAPTVADMSKARLNTLHGQLEQIRGSLETMAIMVGEKALPALTTLAQWGVKGLNWLLEQPWGQIAQDIGSKIGGMIPEGLADKAKGLVGEVGDALPELGRIAGDVGNGVARALGGLWKDISPTVRETVRLIGDILSELAGAIRTILEPPVTWLRDHWSTLWGDMSEQVSVAWDQVKLVIETALKMIQGVVKIFHGALTGDWQEVWDGVSQIVVTAKDFVVGTLQNMAKLAMAPFDTIGALARSAFDGVLDKAGDLKDGLADRWNDVVNGARDKWNDLRNVVEDLAGQVRDAATAPVSAAKNLLSDAWDEIERKATNTWRAIQRAIGGAKDDMIGVLKAPFEWFRDNVGEIIRAGGNAAISFLNREIAGFERIGNAIGDAINWIANKIGLGDLIQGRLSIPRIPELARGTRSFEGGWAIVGEEGPELVRLPRGAEVIPSDQTRAILAGTDFALPGLGLGVAMGGLPGADAVKGALKRVAGAAQAVGGFVKEWIAKGATALVEHALSAVGLVAPSGDSPLMRLAARVLGTMRDELVQAVKNWLTGAKEALDETLAAWHNPVGGPYTVTQEFGPASAEVQRRHGYSFHTGIDLAGAEGTPILAANRGTVAHAGWLGGYGIAVLIRHAEGLSTLYGHLLRATTAVGKLVEAGERIGLMDSTGNSSGSHLHFEVREHDRPVQPRSYVRLGMGGIAFRPLQAEVGDVPEAILPLDRFPGLRALMVGQPARGAEVSIHALNVYAMQPRMTARELVRRTGRELGKRLAMV